MTVNWCILLKEFTFQVVLLYYLGTSRKLKKERKEKKKKEKKNAHTKRLTWHGTGC